MFPFIEVKASQMTLDPDQLVLRGNDYEAYLSARELIDAARQRARDIEAQAEGVHEQHRQLGWEAGMEQAGTEQATLIQETRLRCDEYYRKVDQRMSEVVLQAVRKVLGEYPSSDLTLAATREALSLVSNQKNVILHVQPEQVAEVRERIYGVLKEFPEVGYIEVVADARLDQGGCILETEIGIIDASVDGQLAALETALLQRRHEEHRAVEVADESLER
ncbi:HrpE/YscL family type III secretion apparatus protein [Pseudomonas sp. MWU13-3659]|uniref:HrpE/YscL family type III secretion apparatus protein n=1 Tax=Pseudomonas sp. MWU13-3659 TaxID=2986964 RepID=UPI0020765A83|nr:HrpE/YscL family type III secretion apparatus protein [Pseudomonas sp. MWU13-3659]